MNNDTKVDMILYLIIVILSAIAALIFILQEPISIRSIIVGMVVGIVIGKGEDLRSYLKLILFGDIY
jgi:hypothetical protein